LSVAALARLEHLVEDPTSVRGVDGLSVRQSLVTEEIARWADGHDLFLVAWVVDDVARLNELVRLGVEVIASDNLAILELLGAQERGEAHLPQGRASDGGSAGG
jgi:hypothetical protein